MSTIAAVISDSFGVRAQRWGARFPDLSSDDLLRFRRLIRSGATFEVAGRAFGVSCVTAFNWSRRLELVTSSRGERTRERMLDPTERERLVQWLRGGRLATEKSGNRSSFERAGSASSSRAALPALAPVGAA